MSTERDYIMEGVVTALSSISHIGESRGTIAEFRNEKIVHAGGIEEVPIFSGNGIRGQLRDIGMAHMCKLIGIDSPEDGLSLPAFHFLFSGGALTSKGGRALDIGFARRLMDAIPIAAIFGGAVGNHIIQGKLLCGKLVPIAAETEGLIPPAIRDKIGDTAYGYSVWDYVQEERYTRRDDAKSESLRPMLSHVERLMLEEAEAHKAAQRESGNVAVTEETGQAQQMRYTVQTLAAGTPFYWRVIIRRATDIQFEAWITTLMEFARAPHIGGKSAVGHGSVKIDFGEWLSVDPAQPIKGNRVSLGKSFGELYREHLTARGNDIRAILEEIS